MKMKDLLPDCKILVCATFNELYLNSIYQLYTPAFYKVWNNYS